MQTWQEAVEWERSWHGGCFNTLGEELKQIAYVRRMGLKPFAIGQSPLAFDIEGRNVIDVGGGPVSLLLKAINRGSYCAVADPCKYPEWVYARYRAAGIYPVQQKGEDLANAELVLPFDEAWVYNCLQHTEDPVRVINAVQSIAKIIRLFEWIDVPISDGHLHTLREEELNIWLNGIGKTENIKENGAVGRCYYGIFLGRVA